MKKKIILGLTGAVIGFLFLGCAGGGSANLQPKSYTTKNVSYKDYKFIKVDPVDNEKITTQKVKDYVKIHADKFGKIIPKPNSLVTLKDIIPSINNPFISTKLFYTFFIFHIIS